jgi:integrase/recombinase XerD
MSCCGCGRRVRATGCNLAVRAINAYLKWAASAERIAYLKEEQRVLSIFALPQVALLTKWKPKGFCPRRLHAILLPLLDTGCRIGEVLSLRATATWTACYST